MQRKVDSYRTKRRLDLREIEKQLKESEKTEKAKVKVEVDVSLEEEEAKLRNKLRGEYVKNIANFKKELSTNEDRSRLRLKEKFENGRSMDESILKSKKEIELNKMRISENTRIDIEKSKADNESSQSHNSIESLNYKLMDLENDLKREMERSKREIEGQVDEELSLIHI
eukprot:TRINITY_DN16288_c0_g1_i1.p2 TRINITY_DN16288_c0_g1~~TRINITY_DN16288_c0_g1_i1.p2  ORF type:complete len:170 (-),score=55.65 TRINITY_DN16288_c0_g1_i1:47-556(-)